MNLDKIRQEAAALRKDLQVILVDGVPEMPIRGLKELEDRLRREYARYAKNLRREGKPIRAWFAERRAGANIQKNLARKADQTPGAVHYDKALYLDTSILPEDEKTRAMLLAHELGHQYAHHYAPDIADHLTRDCFHEGAALVVEFDVLSKIRPDIQEKIQFSRRFLDREMDRLDARSVELCRAERQPARYAAGYRYFNQEMPVFDARRFYDLLKTPPQSLEALLGSKP